MLFIKPVYATCPICVISVGGGLFIAKKLGLDDFIVSIWISGLNTAIAFWIASTIKRKILNNPLLWSLTFYILTIAYFWYSHQLVNKVFYGMTIGLLVFFLSVLLDKIIRYNNKGRVRFYYQKLVIPIILLLLTTLILEFILKAYGYKIGR